MKAVILFSHGSLLCGSDQALKAHAERLRSQGVASVVRVGFLNYSEPPFAQAVAECVAEGATRILVAPYFLIPGYFVRVDLPRVIEEAKAQFPHVEFVVADAIGFDERLADALIASARSALPQDHWRDDIQRASLFCRANPECPLYGSPNCPAPAPG